MREGVHLTHEDGDRAFYAPASDSITLPHLSQFAETAEYYSTAFHELTHSTGHSKRLNRIAGPAFFGSEDYSKEELVAEIGASALVHHVGLETVKSFRNNSAYIQNWLSVLRKYVMNWFEENYPHYKDMVKFDEKGEMYFEEKKKGTGKIAEYAYADDEASENAEDDENQAAGA